MLESLPISDWLHQAGEIAVSRELLEVLVLQFALIAGIFGLAWAIRLATCGFTDRLAERVGPHLRVGSLATYLRGLVTLAYAWLLLVLAERVAARFGLDLKLVGIAATLTAQIGGEGTD